MRVLLIEDSVSLARTIAAGLAEEGFSIDVAHDGENGLHLGAEVPFDAILLDRMLPSIDAPPYYEDFESAVSALQFCF